MGLFDFIFGNKKKEEQERLERERQAELQRKENERIAKEREARLAANRRKEEERKAKIEREKLETMAAELSKDFASPIYKEDRYSEMIRMASFNPFKLTVEPNLNKNIQFGNMVDVFKKELEESLTKAQVLGFPVDEMICGYVFNMIESWYNNAGYVPKAASDAIIEQIYMAIKKTKYSNYINNVDQLKYKMYWDLTHN